MLRSVLGKTLGFVGYAVQYGCVAHCAFEYIGEVVVVGIALSLLFLYDVKLATVGKKESNPFCCSSVLALPWSPPSSTKTSSSLNA